MRQIAEWLKDLQAKENKMPEAAAAQTGAPPPEAHIAEILLSQLAPRLVHLAATLKLPDCLVEGPGLKRSILEMRALR
jgi:hypothetical protein